MSDDDQNPQIPGAPQPPYGAPQPEAVQPGEGQPGPGVQPGSGAPQAPFGEPQSPYGASQPQYASQPPYGGPQAYPGANNGGYPISPSPYGTPAPVPGAGLAIAALIVGIIAFLTGLLPVFGGLIAIAGLVLGILVVRKPVRRGFGWTAIGLSAVALLTNIVALVMFVFLPLGILGAVGSSIPDSSYSPSDEADSDADADGTTTEPDESTYSIVDGQFIDTPCWSYDGPLYFVNNIDSDSVADCVGKLELWGEWEGDVFVPTGAGSTAGQILVDPQMVSEVEAASPGSDVDAFVDVVEEQYGYFSGQGEILSLHETTTIGGVPANITRLDSNAETTDTKAFITVLAPHAYDTPSGQVQMFIISVTTPYENGEEQLQQVIDSWTWK